MNILDYIPSDKSLSVSREKLEKLTGLDDRVNRKLIKKERCSEKIDPSGVILSSSQTGGYWISSDASEIQGFNAEIKSRIRELQQILVHNEQFLLLQSSLTGRDETCPTE